MFTIENLDYYRPTTKMKIIYNLSTEIIFLVHRMVFKIIRVYTLPDFMELAILWRRWMFKKIK